MIGILITARLGSSRLRRKHLLTAGGKTMMQWLIDRIRHEFRNELTSGAATVVIATTQEPENSAFDAFVAPDVQVFRGAKDNIPLRHLQAAKALNLNAILSVDGDDILCSNEAMRFVFDKLAQGAFGSKTAGYPFGMNAWGYSSECLEKALEQHMHDCLETGWGCIFPTDSFIGTSYDREVDETRHRLTLDYEEDYAFFKALIEGLGDATIAATTDDILKYSEAHDLPDLNAVRIKEYWENLNKEISRERNRSTSNSGEHHE